MLGSWKFMCDFKMDFFFSFEANFESAWVKICLKYKLHGLREPKALIVIEITSKLEITFLT